MASGCIVGECYLCNELVFEDEAKWHNNNKWKHASCKPHSQLKLENEWLRKELEDYHKWLKQ